MQPFIKTITPGSFDFREPTIQEVKYSSRGLVGEDLRQLVKRASAEMVFNLRNVDHKPDECLVHLITMGATETTGPNKNGDGFRKSALQKFHRTFLKHARPYRDHKNKDTDKNYGRILMETFRPDLGRGELLVAYNTNKEAAQRNGGLVADLELEKLHKSGSFAVSMSCSVAYDQCSSCENKAKNRHQYCLGLSEGGHCKHGGLKNNMGRVCEDGHQLHADNPEPLFFDISHITNERQADQIAHALGIAKEAKYRIPGSMISEFYGCPFNEEVFAWGQKDLVEKQARIVYRLARIEEEMEQQFAQREAPSNCAFMPVWNKEASLQEGFNLNDHLKALSDQRVVLPFSTFLSLVGEGQFDPRAIQEKQASLSPGLNRVFRRLMDYDDLFSNLEDNPYLPLSKSANSNLRTWADYFASAHSVSPDQVYSRSIRYAMQFSEAPQRVVKNAAFDETDPCLKHYGLYQIGVLFSHLNDADFQQQCENVIRSNFVTRNYA